MGVRFYCGIAEKRWNHHPVAPGAYACISPVKGASARTHTKNSVYVPEGVQVIQDSGAFSDSHIHRLPFQAALDRQIAHAEQYDYADKITHRASYDLLIDEVWDNGNRFKRRWSVEAAEGAVTETIAAARFLDKNRGQIGLIQSAQGVDADQYLRCVQRITPLIDPERDILGLGGWCIIGKMPKVMMPTFRETILKVIPFATKAGIQRVHIWGVVYPKALGELLWMCDQHGLSLSTDSVGASTKPVFGEWGYGDWIDRAYQRPGVETRGIERARHVQATVTWLNNFRNSQYFRPPRVVENPVQLELFSA